ncbi:MAG: phosphoribosylamine--glycine ligase [Lachnospirales bacterium]
MKVLLIGSGGRENAMAESILKSKKLEKLFVLPGNFGTSKISTSVDIDINDNDKIIKFVKENSIDLTIVGPEAPIMNGIANDFNREGLKIFAPLKESGNIEGSKVFAKQLMKKYYIPSASYEEFDNSSLACEYVYKKNSIPTVIKYDGLASGKGVYISTTLEDAKYTLQKLLDDKILGEGKVIVEDFLEGEEFTLMAFVKGEKVYTMPIARDFKRIYNEDKGDNTGGMGCICPYDKISQKEIDDATEILKSTAKAMVKEGVSYTGILYGGFIATKDGVKVIEFNARFGDPETEVVLQKIKDSVLDIILDLLDDKEVNITLNDGVYTGVVVCAKGYPSAYVKNVKMDSFLNTGLTTYHMSTYEKDNSALSSGGRVLCVTNNDITSKASFEKIYSVLSDIKNEDIHYRTDLGNY